MREQNEGGIAMAKSYEVLFLNKMMNNNCWGGKHMDEQHVLKCVNYLPPDERRKAIKAWDKLLKEGLIIRKPSKKDFQVSLNPRKKTVIQKVI